MANPLAPKGVFTPLFTSRSRLSWIKRRTRCIALAFLVNRREAVASAAGDWHMFNPTATN